MSLISQPKEGAFHLTIEADQGTRRLDNFLHSRLGDIPKSRIYRMIRKGEVRVNGGRVDADYRLQPGDRVRLPPLRRDVPAAAPGRPPAGLLKALSNSILLEDESLLVINKPAGIPVHGGSGRRFGVIEVLRFMHPEESSLQLVHRLDEGTSGCLLLARDHTSLRQFNAMLRDGAIRKEYTALLVGRLPRRVMDCGLPLDPSARRGGERFVQVSGQGKPAQTRFIRERLYADTSLVTVRIGTGRTHQIRAHAVSLGYPVAGDTRYGDRAANRALRSRGLRRMFLHASRVVIPAVDHQATRDVRAPLPPELETFLASHA